MLSIHSIARYIENGFSGCDAVYGKSLHTEGGCTAFTVDLGQGDGLVASDGFGSAGDDCLAAGKPVFRDRLYRARRACAEEYARAIETHIGHHPALVYRGAQQG